MKKMKTRITAIQTKNRTASSGKVDDQVMKVGLAAIGLASCAIGIWAVLSLAGGIAASGGPFALLVNWFRAITG